jgi:hypothetical protein
MRSGEVSGISTHIVDGKKHILEVSRGDRPHSDVTVPAGSKTPK